MTKIAQYGDFSYHANGGYISAIDSFHIRINSQLENSRFPDEQRNVVNLTLTGPELDALIVELQNTRVSTPPPRHHEEFAWLNGTSCYYEP